MGLVKSAALVCLSEERTALMLVMGPSQPDTMLPPNIAVAACATAPNVDDVAAGRTAMHDAVATAGQSIEPSPTAEGAAHAAFSLKLRRPWSVFASCTLVI